jgi:hypothetical protein
VVLGFELRASCLLYSTTWATPPALFCVGYFKIGSHELFPQAGFELWSSWSLPSWIARITGMSHRCQGLHSSMYLYYCIYHVLHYQFLEDCYPHYIMKFLRAATVPWYWTRCLQYSRCSTKVCWGKVWIINPINKKVALKRGKAWEKHVWWSTRERLRNLILDLTAWEATFSRTKYSSCPSRMKIRQQLFMVIITGYYCH